MDKPMAGVELKEYFLKQFGLLLSNDGYTFIKSKSMFKRQIGSDVMMISVFFYYRKSFIEIQTLCEYDNKQVAEWQKKCVHQMPYQGICGGTAIFICEHFFKQKYERKYTNIVYEKDTPKEEAIRQWQCDYTNFIAPFFSYCTSVDNLNRIVNEEDMEHTGMNLSYPNRAVKSLLVGKMAKLSTGELRSLAEKYDEFIENNNIPIAAEFQEVKRFVFQQ